MRVLIAEDDPVLRAELSQTLRDRHSAVDEAGDGEDALHFAMHYPIDVAIVDIGLPKLSGLEVIRRARSAGKDFPILILTARGRWQEKVEGLEAGADDYVAKPFEVEELLARLRALARRSRGWTQAILRCGPVALDSATERVTVGGTQVSLTGYEYRVLHYLMLRAGEVVSKTDLLEHIYDDNSDPDSNVIEVFVRRLRTKLDPTGEHAPIETVRGRGYRLVLPRAAGE